MMESMKRTHELMRPIAAVAGLCALGVSLAGCGFIESVQRSATDAWLVTYEVSTDSADDTALTDISYLDTPNRVDGQQETRVASAEAEPAAGDGGATWSVESLVMVGDRARIAATPADGAHATCRILLDGEKEIAFQAGDPGEPVL